MSEVEYRIEYQVQRMLPGEDDFSEIGFGSSGGWNSVEAAAYALGAEITHRHWTPVLGAPEPEDVKEPNR